VNVLVVNGPFERGGIKGESGERGSSVRKEHEERDYVFCFFMVRSFGYYSVIKIEENRK
jgi:hypothetical protein